MVLSFRILCIGILTLIILSTYGLSEGQTTTIEDLRFSQIIQPPIDPTQPQAFFQPIDMRVTFENPCWAINETIHSIRIVLQTGLDLIELESQIYDLSFKEDQLLSSCNIVFLIPPEVTKNSCFQLRYTDKETEGPKYPDHVYVKDLHHFYEPISGQSMDFDYYQIDQDDNVIYGILQKGILMGNGISHTVVKCKENTKTFEMFHTDQVATFYISHHTSGSQNNNIGWTGTGWANDIEKTVLVDGNLMVKLRIKSISPEQTLLTDNIYTYYFCPDSTKRLFVDAHHEVLNSVTVTGALERDGTYTSLSTFKSRIAAIEKMNIGKILPILHVYGEDETIKEFFIPSDPSSSKEEWILSTHDDCDIGSHSWVCLDDTDTGKAHGIIFASNTNITNNEQDGLQVKAAVKQHVKLPGLEADTGDIYITRNSYESGGTQNLELTKGLNICFQAVFVTFEAGGYTAVDTESDIYKALIVTRPTEGGSSLEEDESEHNRFTLTAFVHSAPSFPFGSMVSATLGRSFSFITVELYKDNRLSCSGSAGRLPIGTIASFTDEETLIQKTRQILTAIDLRNSSIFKKIEFPDLSPGRYVVKVYKENTLFDNGRQFIGCNIIDIDDDTKTHVYCKRQAEIQVSTVDEEDRPVSGLTVVLSQDDSIISTGLTDGNGSFCIAAPYDLNSPYTLQMFYQGFLVEEKEIHLGLRQVISPVKQTVRLPLHTVEITVVDTLGLAPAVDLSPVLLSENMREPVHIQPSDPTPDHINFSDIYSETYTVLLSYKSFEIKEDIVVDKDTLLEVVFPAEYTVSFDVLNQCGLPTAHGIIKLRRETKTVNLDLSDSDEAHILLPPGSYQTQVFEDETKQYDQVFDVGSEKTLVLVTDQESMIHIIFIIIGLFVSLFAGIYGLMRKNVIVSLRILALGLILISMFSPWWQLTGSDDDVTMVTTNYLFPSSMISFITTQDMSFGEKGLIPPEITVIFDTLVVLLAIVCVGLVVVLLLDRVSFAHAKLAFSFLFILLAAIIIVYLVTMSQVTSLGIGSFMGDGSLDVSLAGCSDVISLSSSWGPGLGFILGSVSVGLLSVGLVVLRYQKKKKAF
jgi:hypothetical protein